MASKRSSAHISMQSTAFAMTPQRLGQAEWLTAQNRMADIAPDWSVEFVGVCCDEASLVIVPEDGDDARGPTFIINQESYGLRLDSLHWDELTEVGVFACLDDAMDAVGTLIYGWSGSSVPATVTLH